MELTKREWEVMQYVKLGMKYKEIASLMILSERTIRTHMYHIFIKLDVNNRVAAIAKLGLVSLPPTPAKVKRKSRSR